MAVAATLMGGAFFISNNIIIKNPVPLEQSIINTTIMSEKIAALPEEFMPKVAQAAVTPPIVPLTPVRIIIPSLNIDAKISPMGITSENLLEAPHNMTDAGWYKYGAKPGEAGNAIIDGHLNNGGAIAGVFASLDKLLPGASIFVVGRDGTQIEYVMASATVYDRNARTENIFTTAGPSELRLITCNGAWLTQQKTHDKRLVVRAVLKDA